MHQAGAISWTEARKRRATDSPYGDADDLKGFGTSNVVLQVASEGEDEDSEPDEDSLGKSSELIELENDDEDDGDDGDGEDGEDDEDDEEFSGSNLSTSQLRPTMPQTLLKLASVEPIPLIATASEPLFIVTWRSSPMMPQPWVLVSSIDGAASNPSS